MTSRVLLCHPLRIVFIAWLAALFVAWPLGEYPLFDDWVYARAAFRLAATGRLAIVEVASAVPPAQIAWGAAFAKLGGASHFVLRLSTIVAVALGALCWRRTLRVLGFDAATTAWAIAIALSSPVMFLLTPTFMTDAPFVAASQAALLGGVLWAASPRWSRMVVATALALVAAFIRQPGAAILVGLAAAAIASVRREQAIIPLAAVAAVGFGQILFAGGLGAPLPLVQRAADALAFLRMPLGFYAEGITVAAAFVGLCAAPAALAAGEVKARAALGWLAVLVLAWVVWGSPVLRDATMWGACELGGERSLLAGHPPSCAWAPVARAVALVLAAIGLAAIGRAAIVRLQESARAWRELRRLGYEERKSRYGRRDVGAANAFHDGRDDASLRATIFLTATFAALAAGMTALWLFADRYWMLPAAVAPALVLSGGVRRPRLGLAAVAVYSLVAVAGTRDVFSFYTKLNAVTDALSAHGVAAQDIDAGYCVNAWRRYVVQPPSPAGEGRNANVPWVSAVAPSPWTIANRLEEGWTPAAVGPLPTSARDRLLVERLRRKPAQRASSGFGTAGWCE